MIVPNLNPKTTYIAISKEAGVQYEQITKTMHDWKVFRGDVMSAFSKDPRPIAKTKELHFAAKIIMPSGDVIAWCVLSDGSPAGNLDYTLNIRGFMGVAAFKSLLNSPDGFSAMSIRKAFNVSANTTDEALK